jgi:hypothetical protein
MGGDESRPGLRRRHHPDQIEQAPSKCAMQQQRTADEGKWQ